MTRAVILAGLLASCALVAKSPPVEMRYFEPAIEVTDHVTPEPCTRIRIADVHGRASPIIEKRISAVEIYRYDTLRWIEPPDEIVRRALERVLVGDSVERDPAGAALAVEVDLIAFEELATPAGIAGHVALHYVLRDDGRVIARGDVSSTEPATGVTIQDAVGAISKALASTARALGARVTAAACPRPR